jgi:hypothetical protein
MLKKISQPYYSFLCLNFFWLDLQCKLQSNLISPKKQCYLGLVSFQETFLENYFPRFPMSDKLMKS